MKRTLLVCGVAGSTLVTGCQDGPLYAIKAANPYYSFGDWKRDEELGVTDHQRRTQLLKLSDTMASLPQDRQVAWKGELKKLIENDQSAEMRRLAVQAAGKATKVQNLDLIELGLDDESAKVRMQACSSLALIENDESVRMLASMVGTESNPDVRHAAISSLREHSSPVALSSLRLALNDRDPATRDLVIDSLRGVTGTDLGDDPQQWIAAIDQQKLTPSPNGATPPGGSVQRIADRVGNLFR